MLEKRDRQKFNMHILDTKGKWEGVIPKGQAEGDPKENMLQS